MSGARYQVKIYGITIGYFSRQPTINSKINLKIRHFTASSRIYLGTIIVKQAGYPLEQAKPSHNNERVRKKTAKTRTRPNPIPPASKTDFTSGTILVLSLFFLFRLGFGLSTEIWFVDQQQIYLLGLKFYTTGLWPYFGPDVAYHIQLPGALQGLTVGLPLYLLPIPEAPYLFLALLSFSGLCLFAWYCSKRLPEFPQWIIWTWLLTAPWTMNWSTNIDNDSYALFGAILFFMGFIESIPALSAGFLPMPTANFMMGFAFLWNSQFHMSYVLMVPYFIFSIASQIKQGAPKLLRTLSFFILGALTSGVFMIPTFTEFGFIQGMGGSGNAVAFNRDNLTSFITILFRFISLACCEIPRFLGANSADRWTFLKGNLLTFPFTVTAVAVGIAQTLTLFFSGFRNQHPQKDWKAVRLLTILTFCLIYLSFLFAIKTPAAHTYYITLPIAMLYGFYVFSPWATRKWFLNTAKVLLTCNLIFHAGLALHNFPTKSLYKDRGVFVKAISEKNYHLLGERRPETLY